PSTPSASGQTPKTASLLTEAVTAGMEDVHIMPTSKNCLIAAEIYICYVKAKSLGSRSSELAFSPSVNDGLQERGINVSKSITADFN
ncbi:hypothetical protein AX14_007149, partial [Amanita brunnescens Koide BX004]